MVEFVAYAPAHLALVEVQPAQARWRELFLQPGYAESLAVMGKAWTGFIGEQVVGAAGFVPQWDGRVIAWAVFGQRLPKSAWASLVARMRAGIDGELKEQLGSCGHGRVEFYVPVDFAAGLRLAALLGFEVEGRMKKFAPDGGDQFLFAKVA